MKTAGPHTPFNGQTPQTSRSPGNVLSRMSISVELLARWRRSTPDDEDAGGGFYDVIGDRLEFVDLEDAADLGEEPLEEAEVPAGDAFDGGDGLGVGAVIGVEGGAVPDCGHKAINSPA